MKSTWLSGLTQNTITRISLKEILAGVFMYFVFTVANTIVIYIELIGG